MSMREEIIQKMYDMMAEDPSDTRTNKSWNEASDAYDRDLPDDKADEYRNYLCNMEHAAFFAGANYVLDFISGREDIERLWADQRVIQMRMNHIEEVLNSER